MGLFLLVIGLICLVFGEVKLSNVKLTSIGQSDYEVWDFACNLTRGRTYMLYIESNDEWGVAFTQGAFDRPMPVNVTISSPEGGVTKLQAFFYGEASTNPLYKQGTPPAIVQVNYLNVDDVGLRPDTSSMQIRFNVEQSGSYAARVLREGLWSDTPPDFFIFYEESVQNGEIYSFTVAVGGVISIIGGVMLVVGIFRKEGTAHRKKNG
jgi:hypothetical protein